MRCLLSAYLLPLILHSCTGAGENKLFCVTLDCNVVFSTSVQVSIPITATVSGGNLGETYKAVQFHLHWGTNGGPGSEHTVDGEQYPITLFNKAISLNQLIPPEVNMTSYYRYDGSLTTPGCTEAVVWTVFENPIPLDREQLRAFSTLKFNDGNPMVGTFRPVQPRNRRVVYRSSGAAVAASAVLILASISAALGLSRPH
uniref:Carbonic anhydrase 4 n=1 Tax=Sinocyclocheilus grahami TaxID=75366 RepID=A0A672RE09_SINGR